jgi:hypothetical protein
VAAVAIESLSFGGGERCIIVCSRGGWQGNRGFLAALDSCPPGRMAGGARQGRRGRARNDRERRLSAGCKLPRMPHVTGGRRWTRWTRTDPKSKLPPQR